MQQVKYKNYLERHKTNCSPTSLQEIQDIISSLRSGKACGPFSIPVPLLKILKFVISKHLEILYNNSFSSGSFLDAFKIARVIPSLDLVCC